MVFGTSFLHDKNEHLDPLVIALVQFEDPSSLYLKADRLTYWLRLPCTSNLSWVLGFLVSSCIGGMISYMVFPIIYHGSSGWMTFSDQTFTATRGLPVRVAAVVLSEHKSFGAPVLGAGHVCVIGVSLPMICFAHCSPALKHFSSPSSVKQSSEFSLRAERESTNA